MSVRIAYVIRLALLSLFFVVVVGCSGSGNKLIGSWTDAQGDYVEHINGDGTFSFEYAYHDSHVETKGNWTYEGTTLHLQPKSVAVTGGTDPKGIQETLLKTVLKPSDLTLEWDNDDKWTGHTAEGGQQPMQRKK